MTPQQFVDAVCDLKLDNVFNPYIQQCSIYDREDAPRLRTKILLKILESAVAVDIEALWLGRDLGHRGGRRTGLAFTDDVNLDAHLARWGITAPRPTKGELVSEKTATVIWSVLNRIEKPLFLWNVFPLHPHDAKDPFTNRAHNAHERHAGEEFLFELINLLRPRRLISVGNDAAATVSRLCGRTHLQVVKIRHPSYGGQKIFLNQADELYGINNELRQKVS